jgi:segregation and condensation protein A
VVRDEPRPDPREVADFLSLASRLLSLKAARLLPEGPLDALDPEAGDEGGPVDDAGARLAEYRLFKAAAEALLGDIAEQGARSFLGLVAPEVVPVERLAIPPERLAAAFRAVLERLPEAEPFGFDTATFSVAEKIEVLRRLLESRPVIAFEEIFVGVASRLEAVACFLALLEILKAGAARVEQSEPFGAITVTALAVTAEG